MREVKKNAGDKPGEFGTDLSRDCVYTEWDGVKRLAEDFATGLDRSWRRREGGSQ